MLLSVTGLLVRNDPLDAVWRESEMGLEFARKTRFGDIANGILIQQRFIATMQGRTANFSTFSDTQFDEAVFEAQLTGDRVIAASICAYWIYKLQARFLAGEYVAALAAAQQAKPLLGAMVGQIKLLDYFYYTALMVAALYEKASTDEQTGWREVLAAHREQLREWTNNYPPTFGHKHALVSAEIARIEGRDLDAMRLYEKAIQSAREHGFVQNEGLACELAASFYAARTYETIAYTYLRNARNCFDRWGALGKVKQLDERYPHLHEERTPASSATIGQPVGQLDVETVVKASQALSSEIVLPSLIEKLMRIAVEHAGAERGLLLLLRGDEPQIEAEATTGHGRAQVTVRQTAVTPSDLPRSALHYVIRTRERVLLDDASVGNLYSEDEYVRQKSPRSILCLPIVKQTKLVGALYLENHLTPCAFTSDRVAVLELLASQAAISLENASLYFDLQRSEAFLAQGQSISQTGSFGWSVPSGEIYWSEETYYIFEQDRAVKPTLELVFQRVHPDDRDLVQQTIDHATNEKTDFDLEHRLLMPDGRVKHVHVLARALKSSSGNLEYVGAVTDVTAAKQAVEALRRSEQHLRESEKSVRLIVDGIAGLVAIMNPEGEVEFVNNQTLEYFGKTLEGLKGWTTSEAVHPDDLPQVVVAWRRSVETGDPYDVDHRLRRADGVYRWFHSRGLSLRDAKGRIIRWYILLTDIDERRRAEEKLRNENVALREEIVKASMFEEIVGTSPPLQRVLSRISKVAPTDSSVLITGETGTGKELVARAIHRRSRRSARAFVTVNCAAIPRDLIASELFGHEKGAFTGATQRRLGRFELAERGTIFLDEIGELPAETQIALLRVLQEHEFERIGGTASIGTDVRVIAATNRDLEATIAAGTFRSDLFYRLNVFPIEIPPLRERREDIPLLVGYFIERYARKAGKNFQAVNKKSLALLQSYPWPGNIRELQNVIERSVIVCEAENFLVDESWLSRQPHATGPKSQLELSQKLASQEKEMIEAVLSESGGRVFGPSGAAAKLGMPRSTLESKIRSLKINKKRFKTSGPSKNR
jgi:PAS domain S-box-containing protein